MLLRNFSKKPRFPNDILLNCFLVYTCLCMKSVSSILCYECGLNDIYSIDKMSCHFPFVEFFTKVVACDTDTSMCVIYVSGEMKSLHFKDHLISG